MATKISLSVVAIFVACCSARGHDMNLPVNAKLGVPGFPDCNRLHPSLRLSVKEAAKDLYCGQKGKNHAGATRIACVGDSITAGVHSTGGKHTYPGQLQLLLDKKYGEGKYAVTNLGACGSTMLKSGDSPYWERPQYKSLVNSTWDIVIIQVRHTFVIPMIRKHYNPTTNKNYPHLFSIAWHERCQRPWQ